MNAQVTAIAALSWAAGVASALFALDTHSALQQYARHKFDDLKQLGEHAADALLPSGFFTFAARHPCVFSMADSGREALRLPVLTAGSSTLPFVRPLTLFDDGTGAFRPVRKGNTMTTIRKAFMRPLYVQHLRTFPTLEAASSHIDLLLRGNHSASYNIQQTPKGWIVGRVAA